MRTNKTLESLVGARVSLQRLRDARFVHGWVEVAAGTGMLVRIPPSVPVQVGDRFSARVFRSDGDLVFDVLLSAIHDESPDGTFVVAFESASQMA